MDENEISAVILDRALDIHRKVGPGLLESVYETVLVHELRRVGLALERQVSLPLIWHDVKIDIAFRADLVVENKVLVELKSVEELARVHRKQVLTYLKLANLRLGLLVNFGTEVLKDGFVRIANGL